MSTTFDDSFINGDIIESSHVKQTFKPIQDLESGAAFYREATTSGTNYVVDFQSSAIPGGYPGNILESLEAGQIIIFKADEDSSANSQLQVLLQGSGPATAPLQVGDRAIGRGDIKANQIVVAIYNDTTIPRFEIAGVGGLDNPVTGEIRFSAGPPKQGYVPAKGQFLRQSSYPELYQVLGLLGGSIPATSWSSAGTVGSLYSFGRLNDRLVAVNTWREILYSLDGTTWTDPTLPLGSGPFAATYAHNLGLYIAAGNDGKIITSPDCDNWTLQTTPAAVNLWSIGHSEELGVTLAGGQAGTIFRSTDSQTWTSQTTPTGTATIWAITYGAGSFVAGDLNGNIITSPDGQTWTHRQTLGASVQVLSYVDDWGLFVATCESGYLYTSPDAVTWTAQTIPSTSILYAQLFADGKLFVGTASGQVIASSDGSTWTLVSSSMSQWIMGFAVLGDDLFAGTSTAPQRKSPITYSYDHTAYFQVPDIPTPEGVTAWLKT